MDALCKLGDSSELLSLLASSEELVVANALGVLVLMGEHAATDRFTDDPRERVRAAARFRCVAS
jgi:hypothetical protein